MFSFFSKREHVATLQPCGTRLVVKRGERLLNAALAAGLDWPHDCRVGSCGTCRCVLRSGQIKPLTDFVYTLTPEDIRSGAILACQSQLKSDVVIDVTLGAGVAVLEMTHGTIVELRKLTHDILEMAVALERPTFLTAKAGQYVAVGSPHLTEPRSYSLARVPQSESELRLTFFIRHVPGGEFTDWLFGGDRRGEVLQLHGPFGAFYQRPGAGRMICVAGGSGLAPIHALLEDGVRNGVARDCIVLFGARTIRDLYYLDELAALGRCWNGHFVLMPVLSEEPADSTWQGGRGLVTDSLGAIAGDYRFASCDQAYLCGPPPMVDAGIERLRALGMADGAIFFDKFLDAGTQPGGRAALP